ncbi:TrkH family potassium uptake protein [Cytobacillus horneckiae]|uniref:Ktr system potassium uptake protein D n=1 Tax=Cytobacillus horneckiae TaxID=549687 RepID=A0A2N0Z8V0_9BACI|nr:TrkH family potassium uptake protein [Cytobacillus horneckiae]MBN6889268.1 TrkH family potassium uptake protein [Cytobacillus horneckiae]MCM3178488.1 TrkH family potassium uptake protein [Cytobacillus horneckiae]MEC1156773.1 TrkH family potassium uptake protein [Cytobacillus horneckiae]MED2940533.1 TrkH family potassium uptake protein [Cytobacillus horneckiae]PKG25935.1 Ktr system potassium uptake protein D [Cytobacillus horneckiae]
MWNDWKSWIKRRSPAQVITAYYIVSVTISVMLLRLPGVHLPNVEVPFIDTVFTAVSAVSVTGLTVVNISETYSVFGYFVIMLIMQFGGIGIMALGTFFWLLLGKKIGLRSRRLIMVDHNQYALSGLVQLVKEIVKIIVVIEIIGTLILGFHFLKYYSTWEEAFLQALFASVSATTNGGLDITGASMIPYAGDYFVQFITIILITLGAIGFPVLIELKEFLFRRKWDLDVPYQFTLFTKLTTITYAGLLVFGTLIIILLEFQHFFRGMSWHESFFYAFFQSGTTRSGGLATMDVSEFTMPTLLVMSIMMFIGASPSSVGGGIRTTTFALNILFIWHFARGNKDIKVFRRELHHDDILKSLVITILAMIICFTSVVIMSITDKHLQLIEIIFEVCSAFGTTGLSMGITAELSNIGKIIIMVLMFVGRIGLTSFLYIIGGKTEKTNYHYPKERIIIG